MIKRVFFKVGNGLFVLESNSMNDIVYDCGGERKEEIERAIDRMIVYSRHITILFISHYDNDHVNGLKYLLTHCKIDTVILPMLKNFERYVLLHRLNPSWQSASFLKNPFEYIKHNSPSTKVVFVDGESNEEENTDENSEIIEGNNLGDNSTIKSGTSIQYYGWQYVIHNIKQLSNSEYNKYIIKLGLPSNPTMQDIIQYIEKKGGYLKNGLRGILSDAEIKAINDYSMVVWSGPINKCRTKYGCLYTGDYNAKKNFSKLYTVFSGCWGETAIIQVPHHGSVYNFTPTILQQDCVHVISARPAPYTCSRYVDPRDVIQQIYTLRYRCEDTRYYDVWIGIY